MTKVDNKIAVLNRQILVANSEYDNANGYGPTLLTIIGLVCVLGLIGIPMLIIAIIWACKNQDARAAALKDIDEFNAEIDELMEE